MRSKHPRAGPSDKRPHRFRHLTSWCDRDGWRERGGEGRGTLDGDGWLDGELLPAQTGDLTATTTARGKGDHQDGPVTYVAKPVRAAGRKHFCQHVAGHRLRALAFPWPRRRPNCEAYRGFQRRGGEDA